MEYENYRERVNEYAVKQIRYEKTKTSWASIWFVGTTNPELLVNNCEPQTRKFRTSGNIPPRQFLDTFDWTQESSYITPTNTTQLLQSDAYHGIDTV